MLWGLAALTILLALGAIALALRGRRVGDAPHCRACDFELTGLDADRCPECGHDLTHKSTIARGSRRRRPVALTLGLALLIVGAGIVAFALSAGNASWNAYKPTTLLLYESRLLHGPARDAAGAELLKRHLASPLANDQLARLIDPALAVQADPQTRWDQTPWWQLLDAAYTAGLVTPEQDLRYLRQALAPLKTTLPESTLAAEAFPVRVANTRTLALSQSRLVPARSVGFTAALTEATLDGEPLPLAPLRTETDNGPRSEVLYTTRNVTPGGGYLRGMTGIQFVFQDIDAGELQSPLSITPGEHTLGLTYHVRVFGGAPGLSGAQAAQPTEDARWDLRIDHRFTAFASEFDACTPVTANDLPDFNPACTASWNNGPLPVEPQYTDDGAVVLRVSISRSDNAPDGPWIAGRITIRAGGQVVSPRQLWEDTDHPIPTRVILGPPGKGSQGWGLTLDVGKLPRADTVDIVLAPDLREATIRGCTGPVWNEPIVISDVPLDWSAVPANPESGPDPVHHPPPDP